MLQVLKLPPGAVRLASSSTAENDMWGAADGRVLAIQGHPEMTCATALDKILPAVSRSGLLCSLGSPQVTLVLSRQAVGQQRRGLLCMLLAALSGHKLLQTCDTVLGLRLAAR